MGGWWQRRIKSETKEQRSNSFLSFLKNIRTLHLILILIPLLFLTATFYRFDHLKMNQLKTEVLAADSADQDSDDNHTTLSQAEINSNLEKKLKALKTFTESHTIINFTENNGRNKLVFGTGQFYLEHQYNRLASIAIRDAQEKANNMNSDNPNGNIYSKANSVCRPQGIRNGWSWNSPAFIACMTGEIAKYPASEKMDDKLIATIPSTDLFRLDFTSPIWSPTLSGLSVVFVIIILIAIIIRLTSWIFLQLALLFLR